MKLQPHSRHRAYKPEAGIQRRIIPEKPAVAGASEDLGHIGWHETPGQYDCRHDQVLDKLGTA